MPTNSAAPAGPAVSRRPVPERRPVSVLLLDEQNYRFAEEPTDTRQQALLALLLEEHQLEVVGESLAENGYFEQEPLVTIASPVAGKYTVVEGNRRLAALRLLTEADARSHLSPSQRATWDRLAAEAVRRGVTFTDVPTVRYPDRAPVQSFLGNRHIAGIKKWDALSKARFLSELIDRRGSPVDFAVVANEIGSDRDTVRDTYLAYRAYLQARDTFKVDTRGISKAFSVFFRTFQYAAIRGFVGADAVFEARDGPEELGPLRGPIPIDHREQFEEVIGYVHGAGKVKKVLPESRKLKELASVLGNPTALRVLRESRDLTLASEFVGGEESRLITFLRDAATKLEEAKTEARKRSGDHEVEEAVLRCARAVDALLDLFPSARPRLEADK